MDMALLVVRFPALTFGYLLVLDAQCVELLALHFFSGHHLEGINDEDIIPT